MARILADSPGSEFTPRTIACTLGRSSGAVANALATLTERGQAERTSRTPQRYRATASSADAAKTSPAPARAARPARKASASASPTPSAPAPTTATPPASSASAAPAPVSVGTAATAPGGEAVVSGPVARPNGQMYHPRTLSGLPDVTALRKLRAAGIPALLYGPPGTGKTSVVEAAFPDVVTVAGDGDTTVGDLVGDYTQTPDGKYVFVPGPLVTAMREGRPLFIDDATLVSPSVLAVSYPSLDGRRQIIIKAHRGEVVTASDGFYMIAGHNPGVHGAVLSDALSSRFLAHIEVTTDFDLAGQLEIDHRAIRVARNLATRQSNGEVGWVPQLRELIAFAQLAEVLGTKAAAANLVGIAPEEDRDVVAAVVRDAFGATVKPLALGRRIDTHPNP